MFFLLGGAAAIFAALFRNVWLAGVVVAIIAAILFLGLISMILKIIWPWLLVIAGLLVAIPLFCKAPRTMSAITSVIILGVMLFRHSHGG